MRRTSEGLHAVSPIRLQVLSFHHQQRQLGQQRKLPLQLPALKRAKAPPRPVEAVDSAKIGCVKIGGPQNCAICFFSFFLLASFKAFDAPNEYEHPVILSHSMRSKCHGNCYSLLQGGKRLHVKECCVMHAEICCRLTANNNFRSCLSLACACTTITTVVIKTS